MKQEFWLVPYIRFARSMIKSRLGEAKRNPTHIISNYPNLILQDFTVTVADLPEVNYSKDSDDNLIIATAIAGKADLIVTGDKGDLLILKTVENISIVTASDAVSIIGIEKTDTNLS